MIVYRKEGILEVCTVDSRLGAIHSAYFCKLSVVSLENQSR
jgi:hypothetical protein